MDTAAVMTSLFLLAAACTGAEPLATEPDLAYVLRPFTLAPDHLAVARGDQVGRCRDAGAHQPCHSYTADARLELAACDRTTTCDRYVKLRGWILIDDALGDQLSIAADCEPERPLTTRGPAVGTRVCVSFVEISLTSGIGMKRNPDGGSWTANACGTTWIAERITAVSGVRDSGPLPIHRALVDTLYITIDPCMEPPR